MMLSEKTTTVSSLYILKAISAMAVVGIHAPMGGLRDEVNTLASLAVPLFFCITGYFIYSPKVDQLRQRAKYSVCKLMPVILILQSVYAFVPHSGFPLGHSFGFYLKWLLVGINHNQVHLWYLTSLLWAMAFLWLCGRKYLNWFIGVGVIAFFAHYYLAGYVFTEHKADYWHDPVCYWFRYVLATGVAFVSLGIMLSRWQRSLQSVRYVFPLMLILVALLYGNSYLSHTGVQSLAIFLRPILLSSTVITIFTLCLQYPSVGCGSALAWVGQYLSASVYYWHILVLWLVCRILPSSIHVPWAYVLTVVGSLLLALALRQSFMVGDYLLRRVIK